MPRGTGRSSQCAAKDGARSGTGSRGGGEACRLASRDKDGREHSVHAASQKGIGISRQRGESVKSFLRHDAQSGQSSSWVQPASEKRFWHVPWRSSCLATPTLLFSSTCLSTWRNSPARASSVRLPAMLATKKAVNFPKPFDGAPTLLCSSMRSKRLIRRL